MLAGQHSFWHSFFFFSQKKHGPENSVACCFLNRTARLHLPWRMFFRDTVWEQMQRGWSRGVNGVAGKCEVAIHGLRGSLPFSLLKGAMETDLCIESMSLNATPPTPLRRRIAETIICTFSPCEELTEKTSVVWACICAIMPAVYVYPMHLCTEVLAKGVNTMKVKIMNSDSSCFILTESEQNMQLLLSSS